MNSKALIEASEFDKLEIFLYSLKAESLSAEYNFSIFEKVQDIVTQQAGYYGIPRKEALDNSEKYLRKLSLWENLDFIPGE